MANPMDTAFGQVPAANAPMNINPQNIGQIIQQIKQNPSAFVEQMRTSNPQAYQMALHIRNSANPQALIMQMAQASGINPNVLSMLGIR